jgi:hypothetical protein
MRTRYACPCDYCFDTHLRILNDLLCRCPLFIWTCKQLKKLLNGSKLLSKRLLNLSNGSKLLSKRPLNLLATPSERSKRPLKAACTKDCYECSMLK